MGGFEKQRVEQAISEAESQEEDYRLYNNKYGVDLETIRTKVLAVGRTGEILTDVGTLRLAGIKFDAQAFSFEDPNSLLAKYGIKAKKWQFRKRRKYLASNFLLLETDHLDL